MPELYLLIIFSADVRAQLRAAAGPAGLFGWMGLSDYVRAEFLRNRQMDYVRAARALGVGNLQIMWRHILPNSMTPVVTFLPFRMSAAILALTSLDFLGLGVPPGTPSLGELLSQGKNNIDAWWISLSTFVVLVVTLLLLTFMGDALRDALDPRKAEAMTHDRCWTFTDLRVAFGGKEVVHGVDFSHRRRREAGAGRRVGLGQDRHGAQPAAAGAERRRLGRRELRRLRGQAATRDLLALPERELRGIRGKEIAMIFQEPMTALNPLYTRRRPDRRGAGAARRPDRARRRTKRPSKLLADTGIPEPERARATAFRTSSRAASGSAR